MSIANFVREAGERIAANAKAAFQLHPGQHDSEKRVEATPTAAPSEGTAGDAIAEYIRSLGLKVDDLKVKFDAAAATVHVSGTTDDQATREKVILCCGNVSGVEKVDDDISVRQTSAAAQYHTVVKGETLSAIAKKAYGDASKYPVIFEANKPMLKDPNKIYPGQSLRIPPLQ